MQKYNGTLLRKFDDPVQGNASVGTSVVVRKKSDNSIAPIYSVDDVNSIQKPNPFTTDAFGRYSFFAPNGKYLIQFGDGSDEIEISMVDNLDLSSYRKSVTISQIENGDFEIGTRLSLESRANARFNIEPIGSYVVNGFDIIEAGAGRVAVLQYSGVVNVLWLGADNSGAADATATIRRARAMLTTGTIYVPKGSYRISNKLSFNDSGLSFVGDGTDLTYLLFYNNPDVDYKTGVEINNGSWNEISGIYTTSGISIGSSNIRNMSIVSVNKSGATGVVLSRATKQCFLSGVKIVGWDIPYRAYGAWYAHLDNVSVEANSNGARIGYETNNFSVNGGDYTNNINSHIEFESSGTCRSVSFNGVAFDGLPAQFGIYAKNASGLTFSGATYMEIYNGDPTTPPMLQCGQNVVNVDISNIDLIFPSDNTYTGSAIKLGTGVGVGAIGVNISNLRQYNSSSGVSINCTNAREVEFGNNIRVSSPMVLSLGDDTISTTSDVLTIPETTGTDEFKGVISIVRRPFSSPIKLQYLFSKNAVFSGQKLRIIRGDTNAVVVEYGLGSETGGTLVDLPIITGIVNDVPLIAYTYKVGSSITWPAMTIICLQV